MASSHPPNASAHSARVALAVCIALFALGQFHRASGSVFSPLLVERFALSASALGILVSSLFFANVVAQVPAGMWLDRVGPRRAVMLATACVALGTLGFAIAQSPLWMIVSRVSMGLGMAVIGAGTQVLLARSVAPRQFGYANGLVVSFGGIGGLLGTYPLAVALDALSWTVVFAVIACATLALATAIHVVIAAPVAPEQLDPDDKRARGFAWLLRQPDVLRIVVLGLVCYAPITTITGLWGGPFFQDVLGLSAQHSGAVLSLCFAATIVAGYCFGQLDRHIVRRRRLIVTSALVSAAALLALTLQSSANTSLSIALLLVMIFSQQFYVPLTAHLRRVVPADMLGRAVAAFTLVAVLAIPMMQTGFGIVLDVTENAGWSVFDRYRAAFALMGGFIVLCAAVYARSEFADDEA
ncbi:MAG: MFS transporter [Pseudomonadota bacterium]